MILLIHRYDHALPLLRTITGFSFHSVWDLSSPASFPVSSPVPWLPMLPVLLQVMVLLTDLRLFHLQAFVRALPCEWKALPPVIHLSKSYSSFKIQFKSYLPQEAFLGCPVVKNGLLLWSPYNDIWTLTVLFSPSRIYPLFMVSVFPSRLWVSGKQELYFLHVLKLIKHTQSA